MSLSILSPLPDLQARIRQLEQDLFTRNRQLNEAEDALRQERQKTAQTERGVQELRNVLNPLYSALQHIYGEINNMGVDSTPASTKHSVIWESWKQKLGGLPAKAIDALLLHGEMSRTQLRIHVGCATGSVADLVYRLNQAGIINKNGGKISLKEL